MASRCFCVENVKILDAFMLYRFVAVARVDTITERLKVQSIFKF